MSYRTIKRIIGESHLERKCRFLFGTTLFLLIVGSFWWYGNATDALVEEKTRSTCRHLVDKGLTKKHAIGFQDEDSESLSLFSYTLDELDSLNYDWTLLSPDESAPYSHQEPAADELRIIDELRSEFAVWRAEVDASGQSPEDDATGTHANDESKEDDVAEVTETTDPIKSTRLLPFRERKYRREDGQWVIDFYQPVNWHHESCTLAGCHPGFPENYGMELNKLLNGPNPPFHVAKVSIDYDSTQNAITKNRAILLATAIITVFLAMIALYVVVRYVIVKPLHHLHDVTDQISRGNYAVRSDIHTNDEFELLAESLNRMLRHLVEAHEELRDVNENLDAKVDELAQANMQLFEANRLKSDFLANMSHELRTPLNSIIGFAEVLQSLDSLQEKHKKYARNIGQSGRVLLEMINEILDLAKMESGKMDVSPTEFSIMTCVNAQCDMVRSLSEEKNIDLEVFGPTDLPDMFQDQGKVQQILINLLSNAIKFTPEGGRIEVSVARNASSELELRVTDTGVGISDEDRDIIFEKFRQGTALKFSDNLTREFTGTGLGLSIVKELCKLLGGEITFQSELGKGSSFLVRIPWTRTRSGQFESKVAATASQPSAVKGSGLASSASNGRSIASGGRLPTRETSLADSLPDTSPIPEGGSR